MTDSAAPAPIEAIIAEVREARARYFDTIFKEADEIAGAAIGVIMNRLPRLLDHIDRLTETHESDRLKLKVLFAEIDRLRAALAAASGPVVVTEEARAKARQAFAEAGRFPFVNNRILDGIDAAINAVAPHLGRAVLPSHALLAATICEASCGLVSECRSREAATAVLALFARIAAGSEGGDHA